MKKQKRVPLFKRQVGGKLRSFIKANDSAKYYTKLGFNRKLSELCKQFLVEKNCSTKY